MEFTIEVTIHSEQEVAENLKQKRATSVHDISRYILGFESRGELALVRLSRYYEARDQFQL